MTKRWLRGVVVFGVYHQRLTSAGPRPLVFFLRVRTLFVLARCTETICHYVSKCKTRTPCIVMCHLSKLPGPLPQCSSCNATRPGPLRHARAPAWKLSTCPGLLKWANLFAITCKLFLMSDKTLSGSEEIPNENKKRKCIFLTVFEGTRVNRGPLCRPRAENAGEEGKLLQSEGFFSFFLHDKFFGIHAALVETFSVFFFSCVCVCTHTCCCMSV